MHVKFIVRGTGSAKVAADYLLGERDAATGREPERRRVEHAVVGVPREAAP